MKQVWIEMLGPWAAGKSTAHLGLSAYCIDNGISIGDASVFYRLPKNKKLLVLGTLLASDFFRSILVFAILLKSYVVILNKKDLISKERKAMIRSCAVHYIARSYIEKEGYMVVVWEGEYHHIPAIGLNKGEITQMCTILARSRAVDMRFLHLTDRKNTLVERIVRDNECKINSRLESLSKYEIEEYLSEYLRMEEIMLECIESQLSNVLLRPDGNRFNRSEIVQVIGELAR